MRLRLATSPAWTEAVLSDFDAFLLDHAANERKASASALALVAHYPDRAIEELKHFQAVQARIAERGRTLGPDVRSDYLHRLAAHFRAGSEAYFLDRLLTAAVVEARGCERFGLVAAALPEGDLKEFYRDLARSEVRHQGLYRELALAYFGEEGVRGRLDEILEAEARVVASLPVRPALY